jgi:hypothetical protein
MIHHDIESLEKHLEKKHQRRTKRGRPAMIVSGASVKKLQQIIIKRSRLDPVRKS